MLSAKTAVMESTFLGYNSLQAHILLPILHLHGKKLNHSYTHECIPNPEISVWTVT